MEREKVKSEKKERKEFLDLKNKKRKKLKKKRKKDNKRWTPSSSNSVGTSTISSSNTLLSETVALERVVFSSNSLKKNSNQLMNTPSVSSKNKQARKHTQR